MANSKETAMILLNDNEHFLIYTSLIDDVITCWSSLKKNNSQFWRRAAVRSFFAFVEGMTFRMKRAVLIVNEQVPQNYSNAEMAILQEEQYGIEKGKATTAKAKISLTDNLEFGFEMYFRLVGVPYDLKKGTVGWEAFRGAIKIRDRITHPKSSKDMTITDDELEIIKQAFDWYRAVCKDIFALSV